MRKTFAVAVCCILFGSVAQAPAQPPTQIPGSKHMSVAINGVALQGPFKVTGLTSLQQADLVQQRENGPQNAVKTLPGRQKSNTLVLTRAVTPDESLREWHKSVVKGRNDRRSVDITVYNGQDQPLRTYHFTKCWPVRYSGPDSSVQKSGMGTEKIELTYESVQVK